MPIQDGKYVAPNWNNSSPPPINASELNALSQTAEKADTNYTRDEILSDEVKQLIGLDETATPNDAFAKLSLGEGKYGYVVHVQITDESPVPGAKISGTNISPVPGYSLVTDDNGNCIVTSSNDSITISIMSPYLDINNKNNVVINRTQNSVFTNYTVTLQQKTETEIEISTSGIYNLSPLVKTYDLCLVGAGGGGSHVNANLGMNFTGSAGGGGGYVENELGITAEIYGRTLTVSVGAGGSTNSSTLNGANGGSTIVGVTGKNISASGGNGGRAATVANGESIGGIGNGNGGSSNSSDAQNGENGTGFKFNENELGIIGGGGGAGYYHERNYTGGSPNGASTGGKANVPGGGGTGGGMPLPTDPHVQPSSGANGIVYLRFHH